MSKRNRQPVNELMREDVVMRVQEFEPSSPPPVFPPPLPLWYATHVRLQLVRAIQIQGDQFVGVQGVSEFWLSPALAPDSGHGYVIEDDHRGLLLQVTRPPTPQEAQGARIPTQRVFVGWGNIAGITERTPK